MNTKKDEALDPNAFSGTQAECYGCDLFTDVDDMMLCAECSSKLDRDMIRLRDWDRSITAWTTPKDKRESLRDAIIKQYGRPLELIADEGDATKTERKRPKEKRKR